MLPGRCVGLIFLACLFSAGCDEPNDLGEADGPLIMGYYANFEAHRPVSELVFSDLDVIFHSFIYPDESDQINFSDIDQDIAELIDSSHRNRVKVLVRLFHPLVNRYHTCGIVLDT